MNNFLLWSCLLILNSSFLYANGMDISKEDKKTLIMEAKKAIKTVGGGLLKNVKTNMKEGGPVKAAVFCSHNATDVIQELSKNLKDGISVRRITNKPRNAQNIPQNEFEQSTLNYLEKNKNNDALVVKKLSNSHYQVYKPIKIKGKCLLCHGDNNSRDTDAYKEIAKAYPNDKATGYKLGDFRGAFLVDIIKK